MSKSDTTVEPSENELLRRVIAGTIGVLSDISAHADDPEWVRSAADEAARIMQEACKQ